MENDDDKAMTFKPNDKVVSVYDPSTVMIVLRVWGDSVTCMVGWDEKNPKHLTAGILRHWPLTKEIKS